MGSLLLGVSGPASAESAQSADIGTTISVDSSTVGANGEATVTIDITNYGAEDEFLVEPTLSPDGWSVDGNKKTVTVGSYETESVEYTVNVGDQSLSGLLQFDVSRASDGWLDSPDYIVTKETGIDVDAQAPSISNVRASYDGKEVTVKADVSDFQSDVGSVDVTYDTGPFDFGTTLDMEHESGDTYVGRFDIAYGESFEYDISASDTLGNSQETSNYDGEVPRGEAEFEITNEDDESKEVDLFIDGNRERTVTVSSGDTVRESFTVDPVFHDFSIEYDEQDRDGETFSSSETESIPQDGSEEVSFEIPERLAPSIDVDCDDCNLGQYEPDNPPEFRLDVENENGGDLDWEVTTQSVFDIEEQGDDYVILEPMDGLSGEFSHDVVVTATNDRVEGQPYERITVTGTASIDPGPPSVQFSSYPSEVPAGGSFTSSAVAEPGDAGTPDQPDPAPATDLIYTWYIDGEQVAQTTNSEPISSGSRNSQEFTIDEPGQHTIQVEVKDPSTELTASTSQETFTVAAQKTLTLEATEGGQIQLGSSGTSVSDQKSFDYNSGTQVSLSAVPAEGYEFTSWEGDVPADKDDESITLSIDQSREVTAVFSKITGELIVTATDGEENIVANGEAILYDEEFNRIDSKSVEGGLVTWPSLDVGEYHIELYGPNGGFWAGEKVNLDSDGRNIGLVRQSPRLQSLSITDETNGDGEFEVGDIARIAPEIQNDGSQWPVRVRIEIDSNDDDSPEQTITRGGQQSPISPGDVRSFKYDYQPDSTGTQKVRVVTETFIDSSWTKTDLSNWNELDVVEGDSTYELTVENFDYSFAESTNKSLGSLSPGPVEAGLTHTENRSWTTNDGDTYIRLRSVAALGAVDATTRGQTSVGTTWEAPSDGLYRVTTLYDLEGNVTHTHFPDQWWMQPFPSNSGAVTEIISSVTLYDATENKKVKSWTCNEGTARSPSVASQTVDTAISVFAVLGGSFVTSSTSVGTTVASKTGVSKSVASNSIEQIVGAGSETLADEGANMVFEDNREKDVEPTCGRGAIDFEAEAGNRYIIAYNTRASTAALGLAFGGSSANISLNSSVESMEITSAEARVSPPTVEVSEAPEEFISSSKSSEVVFDVSSKNNIDVETSFRVHYDNKTTEWSNWAGGGGLVERTPSDINQSLQGVEGTYTIELRARASRTGIIGEAESATFTRVENPPKINLTTVGINETASKVRYNTDTLAPVEKVKFEYTTDGKTWQHWQTVTEPGPLTIRNPEIEKVRGRATDKIGLTGEWDAVPVDVAPLDPPEFDVRFDEAPNSVTVDNETELAAEIENNGGRSGRTDAGLYVNGTLQDQESISLDAEEEEIVRFTYSPVSGDVPEITVKIQTENDSATRLVEVKNPNQAPTADAGTDREANIGDILGLDAMGSTDPENKPLTYSWNLVESPANSDSAINSADSATATLAPDATGTYSVKLTVTDSVGQTDTDTIEIDVSQEPPEGDPGDQPTETPEDTPTETPEDTPTETPENTETESPDTPEETATKTPEPPTETPREPPEDTPTERPETPTETPETPEDTPTPETPTDTPTETPDRPTETPSKTPTETPEDTPTETPEEPPTETPEDTPTETPEDTPTETPETPDETPTKTPDTPTETPTEPPEDTPTKTPETPEDTPTETPEDTPTETPEDTPTETPETPEDTPTETPETPTDTPKPTETPSTPENTHPETPEETPTEDPKSPEDPPSDTPEETPENNPTQTPTDTPTPEEDDDGGISDTNPPEVESFEASFNEAENEIAVEVEMSESLGGAHAAIYNDDGEEVREIRLVRATDGEHVYDRAYEMDSDISGTYRVELADATDRSANELPSPDQYSESIEIGTTTPTATPSPTQTETPTTTPDTTTTTATQAPTTTADTTTGETESTSSTRETNLPITEQEGGDAAADPGANTGTTETTTTGPGMTILVALVGVLLTGLGLLKRRN